MDIGKSNNNFKDRKLKCFNCNKYGHMAKECWKKKEKETRKYFKYNKEGHIAKNQMMKTTKKMIKRRVLAKISSRYGMRDLCKFSEKIYYSKPTK